MNYSLRMKRLLVGSAAGAMVLATVPTGIAAADAAAVCEDAPENDFDDVAESNSHKTNIDCMAAYSITVGDSDGNFNPGDPVNRGQMATFIARFITQAESGSLDIPADAEDAFSDDDGTTHENAINYLASIDVVAGTGGDNYSPGATVTRGQMARFIVNALEHLGFDVPEDVEDAFDDDNGTTHEDMINILAELQVVSGFNDGTYRPGDGVSRQQMATYVIGAAGAADDQDLWNGEFVTEPVDGGLQIVAIDAAADTIYLSDGAAVTAVEYDTEDDEFEIDGDSVSAGVFEIEADIPHRLESSTSRGVTTHNLITVDEDDIMSGVVGNEDLGADEFDIVEAVSGNVLRGAIDYSDSLYTVDGSNATATTFANNLSEGDRITIVEINDDGDLRFELVNDEVEGTVVDATVAAIAVDVNAEDDADDAVADLFGPFNGVTADNFVVDGDEDDGTDFAAELSVGDTLVYSREGGEVTLELTNVAPPTVTATAEAFNDGADTIDLATGDTVTYTGASLLVDGQLVTEAEFEAALSVGDTVAFRAADAATGQSARASITNRNLQGEVTAADTTAQTVDVEVIGGEIAGLDYTTAPDGYEGAAVRYFVDGEETTVGEFETALDEIDFDEDEVSLVVDGTAVSTNFRLTVE